MENEQTEEPLAPPPMEPFHSLNIAIKNTGYIYQTDYTFKKVKY
jgi:hypothetical protein